MYLAFVLACNGCAIFRQQRTFQIWRQLIVQQTKHKPLINLGIHISFEAANCPRQLLDEEQPGMFTSDSVFRRTIWVLNFEV